MWRKSVLLNFIFIWLSSNLCQPLFALLGNQGVWPWWKDHEYDKLSLSFYSFSWIWFRLYQSWMQMQVSIQIGMFIQSRFDFIISLHIEWLAMALGYGFSSCLAYCVQLYIIIYCVSYGRSVHVLFCIFLFAYIPIYSFSFRAFLSCFSKSNLPTMMVDGQVKTYFESTKEVKDINNKTIQVLFSSLYFSWQI